MKSILSCSAVMAAKRCVGVVAVMALAALPAIGAGSAKQAEFMKTGKEEDQLYGLSTKIRQ
jgi:hypothetical protein